MNGTPQSNFSDEPWRKYHDRIDDNFTKNGKRNEIVEQTRQQLYQSKWADEVQEKFQKFAKSKVGFSILHSILFDSFRVGKNPK